MFFSLFPRHISMLSILRTPFFKQTLPLIKSSFKNNDATRSFGFQRELTELIPSLQKALGILLYKIIDWTASAEYELEKCRRDNRKLMKRIDTTITELQIRMEDENAAEEITESDNFILNEVLYEIEDVEYLETHVCKPQLFIAVCMMKISDLTHVLENCRHDNITMTIERRLLDSIHETTDYIDTLIKKTQLHTLKRGMAFVTAYYLYLYL